MNSLRYPLLVVSLFANYWSIAQNTIMWQVTKNGSAHVSYLLGNYHQMGNSFIDSLPRIKQVLIHADVAVFESIGDPQKVRDALNERQSAPDIEDALSKDDMTDLLTLSSNWGVDVHKLKPMELLVKLQQEYFKTNCGTVQPTDIWDHFDNYLIHVARLNNIRVTAFETDSVQMMAINNAGGNWKELKKPIRIWIRTMLHPDKVDRRCEDARHYMAFKFDYGLTEPCASNALLTERNQQWMQKLPYLLENYNCFVSVGLFHLFTKCGLITLLREEGYRVEPVNIR